MLSLHLKIMKNFIDPGNITRIILLLKLQALLDLYLHVVFLDKIFRTLCSIAKETLL